MEVIRSTSDFTATQKNDKQRQRGREHSYYIPPAARAKRKKAGRQAGKSIPFRAKAEL